jgi:hypothetical protein
VFGGGSLPVHYHDKRRRPVHRSDGPARKAANYWRALPLRLGRRSSRGATDLTAATDCWQRLATALPAAQSRPGSLSIGRCQGSRPSPFDRECVAGRRPFGRRSVGCRSRPAARTRGRPVSVRSPATACRSSPSTVRSCSEPAWSSAASGRSSAAAARHCAVLIQTQAGWRGARDGSRSSPKRMRSTALAVPAGRSSGRPSRTSATVALLGSANTLLGGALATRGAAQQGGVRLRPAQRRARPGCRREHRGGRRRGPGGPPSGHAPRQACWLLIAGLPAPVDPVRRHASTSDMRIERMPLVHRCCPPLTF